MGRLTATFPLAAILVAAPAAADPVAVCVRAAEHGQELRQRGQMSLSRAEFRTCASATCPGVVRRDCVRWLAEADAAEPRVVFIVKDATGSERRDAALTVDGGSVAPADGSALEVDPGTHTFVFSLPGHDPATRTLGLAVGARVREEVVLMAASARPAPPPATRALGTQRVLGLAAVGTGVAGLALGAVFGALTLHYKSVQETDCPSTGDCPSRSAAAAAHGDTTTDGAVSTAGFIAGGALLAGGAALFFAAGPARDRPTVQASVAPAVGPHGAALALSGRF